MPDLGPSGALPSPGRPGGSEVLWSRLVPARLPRPLLLRERLVDELAGGFRKRLVVIVAGPGYGKTTQLAQAVSRASSPVAWLSCD